jgi:hypothetical protein
LTTPEPPYHDRFSASLRLSWQNVVIRAFASTAMRFMLGVTGARGRLTTMTKIAPQLVASKVHREAIDNLQLVDKLFFRGRERCYVGQPSLIP